MENSRDVTREIQAEMAKALQHLRKLVCMSDQSDHHSLIDVFDTFLLGVISTAADLAEVTMPGSAPFIYADVEAAARKGGLRAIVQAQDDTIVSLIAVCVSAIVAPKHPRLT